MSNLDNVAGYKDVVTGSRETPAALPGAVQVRIRRA